MPVPELPELGVGFSWRVAKRYLWSRRSEAFITIITVISVVGVAIGVMVLNMVMAVMSGFQHELRERVVGADSHVVVRHISDELHDWAAVKSTVDEVPGIKSISPYTAHQALLRTTSGQQGIIIRGIETGTASAKQVADYLSDKKKLSKLFAPSPVEVMRPDGTPDEVKLPGIIIGQELAKRLSLLPGEAVSLLSAKVGSSPFGLVPKYKRFKIVGLYRSGLIEYEKGIAYVALQEAQSFFKLGEGVSGLEVRVVDVDQAPQVAQEVFSTLGGAASGFFVQDWTEANRALWEALKLEKKVYFIVLLLIIVMASFSIITTLVMIVLEKRRDIAVLRTLGATTSAVGNIFRIQGAVIGALGTIAGLILGYLGCIALREYGFPLDERIFPVATVPVRIEGVNFFVVGVAAFLICCLATVYPARRASRLEPGEVLRYE